jgi:hypothetical protein
MKKVFFILFALQISSAALAKKNCTNEPESKWMSQEKFKELVEKQGYKIKKFKQPGSCYEIYGTNPQGKEVEIYFNPVNGEIVKSK